jgi:hypothetical protein
MLKFIYLPKDSVFEKAKELNAIPYHLAGAEYIHQEEFCTFDDIVKKHRIIDAAVHQIAEIVSGADTDTFELSPQSAGLSIGLKIYDALYSWDKICSGRNIILPNKGTHGRLNSTIMEWINDSNLRLSLLFNSTNNRCRAFQI